MNGFENWFVDNFLIFFIGRIEVVRKLHIRILVYIVVVAPSYILALVPFGILDVGFVDTFVVQLAYILVWGFADKLGGVLDGTLVLEHFDKLVVVLDGILVLGFGCKLALLFVRKLLCRLSCTLGGEHFCTLV